LKCKSDHDQEAFYAQGAASEWTFDPNNNSNLQPIKGKALTKIFLCTILVAIGPF